MLRAIERLRTRLAEASLSGIIVTRPENRFYLSGFTGSAGTLLITQERALLLTDFRYIEQARAQAPGFEIVQTTGEAMITLKECLLDMKGTRIAYEADHVTVSWLKKLESTGTGVDLEPVEQFVESLRAVKTREEIDRMEQAARLAEEAFLHILTVLKPGLRERDVALELEFFMRRRGSLGLPFEIIVASGYRSSMPHGRASDKVITEGELVTMDFGAIVDGYCSDMTRTVVMGRASAEQREIYDLVLRAHMAALPEIAPGKRCADVDAVARKIIEEAGHGQHFGHGLGHGVGIAVHEMPRLSPTAGDSRLVPGNVVSNEPGVYIPGWGGVRIEDVILVTEDGNRNLNSTTKELIEIG